MTTAFPSWDLSGVARLRDEVEVDCPVRVSIAGGGTDVLSYAGAYGGSIVSLAIDRYVRLTVRCSDAAESSVHWWPRAGPAYPLRLISRVLAVTDPDCRYDVELSCDQSFGSGLGTSSSLVVGLLLALETVHGQRLSASARAANAYLVERVLLGEEGGFQDHLASAFGGFNHYRFSSLSNLEVEPVPADAWSIVRALVVCDSGITRTSSAVLAGQLRRLVAGHEETIGRLHQIRALTADVLSAISAGDVDQLARSVEAGWQLKRRLDPGVSEARVDALIDLGKRAGAAAARVLGAGAGGHVLFVVPERPRADVLGSLRAHGKAPFTVRVANAGARVRYAGDRRAAVAKRSR